MIFMGVDEMQDVPAVTTSIMQLLSREGPQVTGDGLVVKAVIVSQSFKDQRICICFLLQLQQILTT